MNRIWVTLNQPSLGLSLLTREVDYYLWPSHIVHDIFYLLESYRTLLHKNSCPKTISVVGSIEFGQCKFDESDIRAGRAVALVQVAGNLKICSNRKLQPFQSVRFCRHDEVILVQSADEMGLKLEVQLARNHKFPLLLFLG